MNKFLDIYLTFARMGAVCFGGGYAMLPLLRKEVVEKKNWATEEEILDYFVVGQCTPGLIAVNTSTFIGYKQGGVLGGILATLGFITPSVIIILAIAGIIQSVLGFEAVTHAFAGIRICVLALITSMIAKMFKKSVNGVMAWCFFIAVMLLGLLTELSTAVLVLLSGICGLAVSVLIKNNAKEGEKK